MFAGLADVLAHIAPLAVTVAVVHTIFKFLTYALGDHDRWRRLMFLAVPLLTMAVALIAVGVWWLLGDGGLQIILHGELATGP